MSHLHACGLVAFTLLLLPGTAAARDPALAGLEHVVVEADAPPADVEPYGLTQKGLEAALTRALGEWVASPGGSPDVARLRVNMNVSLYGFYSWSLRLQVQRAVAVAGKDGAYTLKEVWTTGEHGTLLPWEARRLEDVATRLAGRLREALAD